MMFQLPVLQEIMSYGEDCGCCVFIERSWRDDSPEHFDCGWFGGQLVGERCYPQRHEPGKPAPSNDDDLVTGRRMLRVAKCVAAERDPSRQAAVDAVEHWWRSRKP